MTTNNNISAANPTASLVEALRNFEGSLSANQRQDFRNSTQRPDASSVMSFVSKIDADNKTRAGRCIAPRLCTFLEAVRQFSDVVDTVGMHALINVHEYHCIAIRMRCWLMDDVSSY